MNISEKRSLVKTFFKELNDKLENFYISFADLSLLSKRKVYKLLKLTYKAEGRNYDKNMLKELAYVISNYNVDLKNKKHIKMMYNIISNKDIVKFIEVELAEILPKIIEEINGWDLHETESEYKEEKKYLSLGELLL